MRLELIETVPGMGRGLIAHDPKSREYAARGVLWPEDAPEVDKVWRRGYAYDQGQTSTCVPHTGKGLLNSAPFSSWLPYGTRSGFDPFAWYPEMQRRDEWPGEAPTYEGTSGLAMARYLLELGLIGGYRWGFGLRDVLMTVSHYGPMALGTWVRQGMLRPDARGVVSYSGPKVGGHEWELNGVDWDREEGIATNSWSRGWGDRGRFRIPFTHLGNALEEDGDALTFLPPASIAAGATS